MIASNGVVVETSPRQFAEMGNVLELLQILSACNKLKEQQQINLLMEQMREMEKNLSGVMKELAAVKEQLNDLTSVDSTKQGVLMQMVENADTKVINQYHNLQNVGKDLNEKAKSVVQRFKKAGITTLDKVCEVLGIKEKLIVMRDKAQSNAQDMQNSIEKIEKIETELELAKLHAKNVAKAVVGKETTDVSEAKGSKLFNKLKAKFTKLRDKYSARVETLNKTIGKFDALEQAARGIKGDKKSLTEKLSENVKLIESRDAERRDGIGIQQDKADLPRNNDAR